MRVTICDDAEPILEITGDSTPPCRQPVFVSKTTFDPVISAHVPVCSDGNKSDYDGNSEKAGSHAELFREWDKR